MINTLEVTASDLASTLGVTDRRIRQLASEGIVVKGAQRGRYALQASVRRYLEAKDQQQDSVSLDALREERLKGLQLARAQKDRELLTLDEAMGTMDEVVGLFVSSLQGMPARITNNPRERRRLDDIFDGERQRLADAFGEKVEKLARGA